MYLPRCLSLKNFRLSYHSYAIYGEIEVKQHFYLPNAL